MIKKIAEFIRKYQMIEPHDTIAAGISGGADSVCLFFILLEIRKQIPFNLKVVHVNHGIRTDAGGDAEFVRILCEKQGIPFFLVEKDVKKLAKESGRSAEEEGRRVRYEAFAKALWNERGKIAVAHNSNDRAETMLFHLFRGTGLTGVCGIRPVNGNVIRPLLCFDRTEIEQWLSEKGISYCTDSTNEQDAYTRNRIRHHILPYAEQEICHGAVAHMNRTADELMMAEEYLKRETEKAVERCVLQGEGCIQIRIPAFLLEDEYLKGRILLYCIEKAAGSRKDISWVHVMAIKRLFQTNGSKEIDLPYRLKVYKQYDLGMIQKCGEKSGNRKVYLVVPPGQVDIPGLGRVEFTVFPMDKSQNIPEKTYTKWFDYDKILSSMKFRARHKGDYLTVKGSSGRIGHKLLQDYFVNEKIPREERDRVYILAEGSHVLWIPGRRISEYYKIDEKTQTILQVVVVDKKE